MGGTDSFDQHLSYYRTRLKTRKWPIRVFTHFLSTCAANAFICCRDANPTNSGMPFLEFLQDLINCLNSQALKAEPNPQPTSMASRPRYKAFLANPTRLVGQHYPKKLGDKEGALMRGSCLICKITHCSYTCEQCGGAFLCVGGENSCFKQGHSEQDPRAKL